MPETSGIIIFTLWYIGIAINYYMGWLPSEEMQLAAQLAIAERNAAAAAAASGSSGKPEAPPPPKPA